MEFIGISLIYTDLMEATYAPVQQTPAVKKTYPIFWGIETEDPNNPLVRSPCLSSVVLVILIPSLAVAALGLGALLDLFFSYILHTHGMFGEFTDTYGIADSFSLFVSALMISVISTACSLFLYIMGICCHCIWCRCIYDIICCRCIYDTIRHELEANRVPVEDENDIEIGSQFPDSDDAVSQSKKLNN